MTVLLATLWVALLFFAAVWDWFHREIPDVCPIGILGVAVASILAGSLAWPASLLGLAAGFLVGLLLFAVGAWGGGDAKLASALGAVLGLPAFLPALLYAAIVGGVMAALAGLRGKSEVAYGPAFAAGVLLAWVLP